jgi:hypothetical protein
VTHTKHVWVVESGYPFDHEWRPHFAPIGFGEIRCVGFDTRREARAEIKRLKKSSYLRFRTRKYVGV